MKRSSTQSIAAILKEYLKENPQLEYKMAETRALQAWDEVMGRAVAKYTKSIYIRKRVLYVQLSSAVLRSELSLCRADLLERLNEKAGVKVIDEIVVR